MIDTLRSIAIFAAVVDQGSFRGAARSLGLAPSRVSAVVSQLERQLGVTLLYRSTRQLSLTHEGDLLHRKALEMLNAAEMGLDAINPSSAEPSGTLRITAPAFVTQTELMDTFAKFARDHPRVVLDFHFSDRPSDMIKDGFDLAFRAGWLEDSALLSRKIGEAGRVIVASPAYVAAKPVPRHPSDLAGWDWVRFSVRADATQFTSKSGEVVMVSGQQHVSVNSADALYQFSRRGLGLTAIPERLARDAIARGELVNVLPDWSIEPLGLFAVWPDASRRENLTKLFVRFLAAEAAQGVSEIS